MEMVRCLPCKHKNLSSDPQNSCKGQMQDICDPGARCGERDRQIVGACHYWAPEYVKISAYKKKKSRMIGEGSWCSPLSPGCTHALISASTQAHTHGTTHAKSHAARIGCLVSLSLLFPQTYLEDPSLNCASIIAPPTARKMSSDELSYRGNKSNKIVQPVWGEGHLTSC